MTARFFLLMAAALAVSFPPAAAAPRVTSISSLDELRTPLPYPFDESADADADVDAALDQAGKAHKLVFIDLGGNWCADCRILAALMELPDVRPFVSAHYVIVNVDVGRGNRNLQIPARWGITWRLEGFPTVLIVDPNGDRLVNAGHTAAIADARDMDPQAIVDWIGAWVE